MKPTKSAASTQRDAEILAKHAGSYPEAYEENPWGHRAFKVKGKTFLFLSAGADGLGLSTKLPSSGPVALTLPFAEPTQYGLGKSGWVSAHFAPGEKVPHELLRSWIEESYRAIAPKKLAAQLDPTGGTRARKRTTAAKTGAKRSASGRRS